MASASSSLNPEVGEDGNSGLEDGRVEEKVETEAARENEVENGRIKEEEEERMDRAMKQAGGGGGAATPEMVMTMDGISSRLVSMEAQMGSTNRLLEELVKEMKGMREDLKLSRAKDTTRSEKLLAEHSRTNDLIEKALYAEPSSNLFANSKDKHPHKAFLRVLLEDAEAIKRKLR